MSAEAERDEARAMLEWCARQVWEGCDIDGGDFQAEMEERGLFVKVPGDEAFCEEWGDDAEMYVLAWNQPAAPSDSPNTEPLAEPEKP